MACVIEREQLYCNTSDVGFGPICDSDEEAWHFLDYVWKKHGMDPRRVDLDQLDEDLKEMRAQRANEGER
jgi:hypothetical protein